MKNIKKPKRSLITFFLTTVVIFVSTVTVFAYLINRNNLQPKRTQALSGDISWRVFDGGIDDPGANYSEPYITTGNVNGLTKLWKVTLPIAADNAVVEEANVNTNAGTMDLVFANTVKGNLIAYNAATGAKVWEADPSSSDYNGQGTKSTPAIDPSGNYIYAYAVDGYIHKYTIATGAEVTGNGFPAQVTLLPNDTEKGSASLNIANNYLYMTISGNDGDYGHYVGHVVAVNLSNGTKTVWNAECANIAQLLYTSGGNYCANTQSGIWARPGVKVDPVTGNVFVATGNGNYNANSGGNNWGDSLIELKPDLSQVVDSYTPTSYNSLDSGDIDLGSTAPAILPKQNGSNTPYMLVQAGKDRIVRLLNRTNLSGQGGPGHTGGELQTISISNEVHEQPAVWVDGNGTTWVYVTDESGDLYAYKVVTSGGTSSLSQAYHVSLGTTSSPFVANGVLYLDGNTILALNATTGVKLFDSSSISISLHQHWESPIVVNGTLFTSDDNANLLALYVPGAVPTPSPTPSPTPTPSPSPSPSSSGSSSSSSSTKSTSGATTTKAPTPSSKPTAQQDQQQAATSTNNTHVSTTVPASTAVIEQKKKVASVHTNWITAHVADPIARLLHLQLVSDTVRASITTHNWFAIVLLVVISFLMLGLLSILGILVTRRLRAVKPKPEVQGTAAVYVAASDTWLHRCLRRVRSVITRILQRR